MQIGKTVRVNRVPLFNRRTFGLWAYPQLLLKYPRGIAPGGNFIKNAVLVSEREAVYVRKFLV